MTRVSTFVLSILSIAALAPAAQAKMDPAEISGLIQQVSGALQQSNTSGNAAPMPPMPPQNAGGYQQNGYDNGGYYAPMPPQQAQQYQQYQPEPQQGGAMPWQQQNAPAQRQRYTPQRQDNAGVMPWQQEPAAQGRQTAPARRAAASNAQYEALGDCLARHGVDVNSRTRTNSANERAALMQCAQEVQAGR